MAKRYVVEVRTDGDGEITALVKPGEIWSPLRKSAAIVDIEAGIHEYFMDSAQAQIVVKTGPSGKRLVVLKVSMFQEDLRR